MAIRRLLFLFCILLLLIPFVSVSASTDHQPPPCAIAEIAAQFLPRLLAGEDVDEFISVSQELLDTLNACPPDVLLESTIQAFSDMLNLMMSDLFGVSPAMPYATEIPSESGGIITPAAYAGVPIGGKYAGVRDIERAGDVAENVSRGVTEDGTPYIGDPNAPIIIAEFFDFTCPHCADYAPTLWDIIINFARSGYAKIELYPLPAASREPGSTDSARVALCAAEQGAFWEMHDAIYSLYEDGTPDFSFEGLFMLAEEIGLDRNLITACIMPYTPNPALELAQAHADEIGISATPTIVYRYNSNEAWRTIPDASGGIGGGRPFQVLHDLIIEANTSL